MTTRLMQADLAENSTSATVYALYLITHFSLAAVAVPCPRSGERETRDGVLSATMSPEFVNYSLDLLSGNTLINRVLYMKNEVSSIVNDNLRARGSPDHSKRSTESFQVLKTYTPRCVPLPMPPRCLYMTTMPSNSRPEMNGLRKPSAASR